MANVWFLGRTTNAPFQGTLSEIPTSLGQVCYMLFRYQIFFVHYPVPARLYRPPLPPSQRLKTTADGK